MPSESEVCTYRCHHCRRLKGEANRWWAVRLGPDKEHGWERMFGLRPFVEPLMDDEIAICSETCVAAEVNSFLRAPAPRENKEGG